MKTFPSLLKVKHRLFYKLQKMGKKKPNQAPTQCVLQLSNGDFRERLSAPSSKCRNPSQYRQLWRGHNLPLTISEHTQLQPHHTPPKPESVFSRAPHSPVHPQAKNVFLWLCHTTQSFKARLDPSCRLEESPHRSRAPAQPRFSTFREFRLSFFTKMAKNGDFNTVDDVGMDSSKG